MPMKAILLCSQNRDHILVESPISTDVLEDLVVEHGETNDLYFVPRHGATNEVSPYSWMLVPASTLKATFTFDESQIEHSFVDLTPIPHPTI